MKIQMMLAVLCVMTLNQAWGNQAPPMDKPLKSLDRSHAVKDKDLEITETIQKKILDDYDLQKYADIIGVYTYKGKVTITGIVDGHQARLRIEQIARGVSGVKATEMHVTVNSSKIDSFYR